MPGHPETVLIGPVPVKLGGTNLKDAPPLDAPLVGNGRGGYKFGEPLPPGGSVPFEYDDAVHTDKSNIITTRTDQSPIDNTKHRIYSAGTTDGELGFGCLDDGATILSGRDCTAAGENATVIGGYNVTVLGPNACGHGKSNIVACESASVEGENNTCSAVYAHAEGFNNLAGPPPVAGTLASLGTTVTIGFIDWTQYINTGFGDTVTLQDNVTSKIYQRTIAFGTVAFDGTNTTFGITVALPADVTSVQVFTDHVGSSAHVEGEGNLAIFANDHAEGGGSIACGGIAHAEGSSLALEENTHSEGAGCFACAIGAHSEGEGNLALGQASHSEGAGGGASGDYSHSGGLGCFAGYPDVNFAITAGGTNVSINGDKTSQFDNGDEVQIIYQQAFFPRAVRKAITSAVTYDGGSNKTSFTIDSSFSPSATGGQIVDVFKGLYANATGFNTNARNDAAISNGTDTNANGKYSRASGNATTADAESSVAEGQGGHVTSTAKAGRVDGIDAKCTWEGGFARASGSFSAEGDAQSSGLNLRGTTPGVGANETVDLKFGSAGTFEITNLENKKIYVIEAICAAGVNVGAAAPQSVNIGKVWSVSVKADGTVNVTGGTALYPQIEEGAGLAGATLVMTANGANGIRLTFGTGAGNTSAAHVNATLRVTEVAFS